MWALELLSDEVAISLGRNLGWNQIDLICVGEPVSRGLECPFPIAKLPDALLDGLLGALIMGGEDDARLRSN